MSTVFTKVFRGMLCAAVAVMITAVSCWGFTSSTAQAPGAHARTLPSVASIRIPLEHSVFGRPQPAVLVD